MSDILQHGPGDESPRTKTTRTESDMLPGRRKTRHDNVGQETYRAEVGRIDGSKKSFRPSTFIGLNVTFDGSFFIPR